MSNWDEIFLERDLFESDSVCNWMVIYVFESDKYLYIVENIQMQSNHWDSFRESLLNSILIDDMNLYDFCFYFIQ